MESQHIGAVIAARSVVIYSNLGFPLHVTDLATGKKSPHTFRMNKKSENNENHLRKHTVYICAPFLMSQCSKYISIQGDVQI